MRCLRNRGPWSTEVKEILQNRWEIFFALLSLFLICSLLKRKYEGGKGEDSESKQAKTNKKVAFHCRVSRVLPLAAQRARKWIYTPWVNVGAEAYTAIVFCDCSLDAAQIHAHGSRIKVGLHLLHSAYAYGARDCAGSIDEGSNLFEA